MHLLIPFASALSQEAVQAMPSLALPNLARLLARLAPVARDDADEYRLSPPHERALGVLRGWRGEDGRLPFAAHAAAADGVDVGADAWGFLTPTHWHVGRDHITLADPDALALDADGSRALFDAVRGLFESEGFAVAWGAPTRWYLSHPSLASLPCASLDRVIGRNVDFWLDAGARGNPHASLLRRLQSEVQLLLYPHPINEAREARGEAAVNSFWLSGCGAAQPARPSALEVDATLRRAQLDGDGHAWIAAWSALDAGPVARLLDALAARRDDVALTLCGERSWQRFEPAERSLWQRLRGSAGTPKVPALLEGL